MRRAVIVALFVLAWTIGPVVNVDDGPAPPRAPTSSPTATVSR